MVRFGSLILLICLFLFGGNLIAQDSTARPGPLVNVTSGEYFWDTDQGEGQGTQLSNFSAVTSTTVRGNGTYNTDGLSEGFHTLYVRFQDADGAWGVPVGRTVYIQSREQNPTIAEGEVFVDTPVNPETGQSMSPVFASDEPVFQDVGYSLDSFDEGFHNFIIQLENSEGVRGIPVSQRVFLRQEETVGISDVEVFVNSDPGFGEGTRIGGNNQNTVNITEGLSTSIFQKGFNKLFVRLRNDQGVWGAVAQGMVYLPEAQAEAKTVAGLEIFFNQGATPNPGEATALEANDGDFDSDLEYGSVLAQTPFDPGEIGLYARTQNSDGDWGIPIRKTLDVIESRAIQGKLFTTNEEGNRVILPNNRITIDYPGQQFESYATTDNRGFFSISDLEPNTYTLSYLDAQFKRGVSIPDRAVNIAEVGSEPDDVQYIEMDVEEPFKLLEISPQSFTNDISREPEFSITFNKAVGTGNGSLSDSILYIYSKSRGALGYTQSLSNGDSVVTVNLRETLSAGDKIVLGLRPILSSDGIIIEPFETHYFTLVSGGGDVFTKSQEYTIPNQIRITKLVDVDKDSDLDILTVTSLDSLYIHENNGNGVFTRERAIKLLPDTDYSAIDQVAVDDINHDGYPDIVVYVRASTNGQAEIRSLINNGEQVFTQTDKVTFAGNQSGFLKIETLGFDGYKYILAETDSIIAVRVNDSYLLDEPVKIMPATKNVVVGDVTGDGIPDIATVRNSSTATDLRVAVGGNRSLSNYFIGTSGVAKNFYSPTAGFDFDQNGIMDLFQVTRSSSNNSIVYSDIENSAGYLNGTIGNQSFTTYSNINPVTSTNFDVALGDILNNGEIQMIASGNSYPDYDIVYTGKDENGTLVGFQALVEGGFDLRYYTFDTGDIDNDGDIDIIAGAQIFNGSSVSSYSLEIQQNRNGNIPPTLEFEFDDQSLTTVSDPLTFNLQNLNYVTDPDGGGITFSATSSNESIVTAEVDGSGIMTLTPVGEGSANVTIQATDGQGESIFDVFNVDVQAIDNDPPAIVSQIPDTTLETDEEALFSFLDIFSDADFLTYVVEDQNPSSNIVSLTLENDNQDFRITPINTGNTTISVSASDQYATTSFTFDITVEQATNDAPVIVYSKPDTVANPSDGAILIPIETLFEDPDGDQLSYSVSYQSSVGVGTAEFSPSGGDFGMLVISPTSSSTYGQFSIEIIATDPSFEYSRLSFNVTFNDEPVERVTIDRAQVVVGQSITYSLSIMFEDQYAPSALTYDIQYDGTSGTASQTGPNLSVQGTSEGTGIVAIRAYDGAFYSDTLSFTVEVVAESFSSISTDVTGSYYPSGVVVKKWGLLSIPGQNITGTPQSILDGLGGDFKLFALTSDGQYEDVTEFTGNPFSPGEALWFKTKAQNDLYQITTPAGSRIADRATTLSVPDGWSFISTPYDIPTNYLSQFRRSLIWKFDHNREEWVQLADDDKLQPWTGYALFSNDGDDIRLFLNATNNISTLSEAAGIDELTLNENESENESESELEISVIADDHKLTLRKTHDAEQGFDMGDEPVMPGTPENSLKQPGFIIGKHLFTVNSIPVEENVSDDKKEDAETEVVKSELFIPEHIETLQWKRNESETDNQDWMMVLVNEKYVRKIYPDELTTLGVRGDQVFQTFIGPAEIVEKYAVPQKHQLFDNYPNPFNPTTTIQFALANQAEVSIEVFNLLGQRVQTLRSGQLSAGLHSSTFNASSIASGVYLYRLVVDGKVRSIKKMTLIK